MATLSSTIERIRDGQVDDSNWLYIAGSAEKLTLETDADVGCPEIGEELFEELAPIGFPERGLQSTIDVQTVRACLDWAERLAGSYNSEAALDVIRYYLRFDAFPERLNSPDPPSREEILRRLDREFSDRLGPEDSSRKCRMNGCPRGAVSLSVFCRRHHFESIQKRPYPFDD